MSEVIITANSVKQISEGLVAASSKQLSIPMVDRYLKSQTDTDLAYNVVNFASVVSIMDASEGHKVILNEEANIAEADLKAHNILYLNVINGKIKFGVYDASVRVNFMMMAGSPDFPSMITRDEVLNVSAHIKTGNAVLVALGLTPPLDFTAAQNNTLNIDLTNKNAGANAATEDFINKATIVSNRKKICRTLLITIRKEVQFHVVDYTDAAMRVYCGLWGFKYRTLKAETEIDILFVWADGGSIVPGVAARIGKLETKEGKDATQGVKGIADAHGCLLLDTTQTGSDLLIIWERTGVVSGYEPITIVGGEDQSLTIHLVKAPPEA